MFAAYLLPFTATYPLLGRLCDIFGRVTIFNAATFVSLIGCALSALSHVCSRDSIPMVNCSHPLQELDMFVSGRTLQAIGAAGQKTVGLIILFDLKPLETKAYWFGKRSIAS